MRLFINYRMGQQAWEGVKPLEDQQLLTSIRRSELLVGHAISLNKKCANWGGGGKKFLGGGKYLDQFKGGLNFKLGN